MNRNKVRLSLMNRIAFQRGFTLIEMLLVVLIISVITAATLPQFVKSMHGNRLKSAARTVIAAGRYARSMAILHQRSVVVTFNSDKSTVIIEQGRGRNSDIRMRDDGKTTDGEDGSGKDSEVSPIDTLTDESKDERKSLVKSGGIEKLERKLDGVTIASIDISDDGLVESDSESGATGSVSRIVYESNGRCSPYQVLLKDKSGMTILIKVDALGSAMTERDR